MKLTEKQKEFLAYVSRYINEWGRPPSFEEICSHFHFSSYNTVTTYLKALERKGYIRLPQKKNQKRAIEVISPVETSRFELPLLGRVAAGKPIEAVEDVNTIEVPPFMRENGDCFVLQVKGDSMEDEAISILSHEWRDLDGAHIFHRLNRFACGHPSQKGKLESPGLHGTDYLNGPFAILFPGTPDIALPLQDLEIGGDRVEGTESEVGADFIKTGGYAPLLHVLGYIV